jgi:hypothetical protein
MPARGDPPALTATGPHRPTPERAPAPIPPHVSGPTPTLLAPIPTRVSAPAPAAAGGGRRLAQSAPPQSAASASPIRMRHSSGVTWMRLSGVPVQSIRRPAAVRAAATSRPMAAVCSVVPSNPP